MSLLNLRDSGLYEQGKRPCTYTFEEKVIGEPEFYQHANAVAGAWTIGATDNLMLDRVAKLVAEYLVGNYEQPVGGKSGYED
jgi:hypothetical protein